MMDLAEDVAATIASSVWNKDTQMKSWLVFGLGFQTPTRARNYMRCGRGDVSPHGGRFSSVKTGAAASSSLRSLVHENELAPTFAATVASSVWNKELQI